MSNWRPTNELRFVIRECETQAVGMPIATVRILQQKWTVDADDFFESAEEWRDVPVEEE